MEDICNNVCVCVCVHYNFILISSRISILLTEIMEKTACLHIIHKIISIFWRHIIQFALVCLDSCSTTGFMFTLHDDNFNRSGYLELIQIYFFVFPGRFLYIIIRDPVTLTKSWYLNLESVRKSNRTFRGEQQFGNLLKRKKSYRFQLTWNLSLHVEQIWFIVINLENTCMDKCHG